jgi:group I intron endonuclease
VDYGYLSLGISMLVYKVTNQTNGKVYIGKWQGKDIAQRWRNHLRTASAGRGFYLHNAIRKYGPENFAIEVVATASSKQELASLERQLISSHQSTNPKIGYNLARGGEGIILSW